MEYKVVVSDAKSGKSYQLTVKEDDFRKIKGVKLGDTVEGTIFGLAGYKLQITGGTDKAGFAMKKGVHGTKAARVLMDAGVGYSPKEPVRVRKRVRGETVDLDVSQLNTKVVEYGGKSIEDTLGIKPEEKKVEKKEETKA
ncbi:MAG: 30S ribosomal protein S6e [Candidatus Altiarchaeota archaeon]|nr:30S ribosomal protein S6e [Candidatus Altiarchaeota archaeon]